MIEEQLREILEQLKRIEAVLAAKEPELQAERLWTVEEVAAFLGRSERSIYQLAAEGRMPTVRLGAHLRFDPQVIKEWVRQAVPTTVTRRVGRRARG